MQSNITAIGSEISVMFSIIPLHLRPSFNPSGMRNSSMNYGLLEADVPCLDQSLGASIGFGACSGPRRIPLTIQHAVDFVTRCECCSSPCVSFLDASLVACCRPCR